ncbi:MAG TPA: MarR family transcriptional regulator [Methylomirabilota bacterium]|nr:MarR family transcriptional regulator [Methylomirabilota bacterium]
MAPKRVGDLLDRIDCLKHPCDLDLLLFFYRHPRAFLISERLAAYVGYDRAQVVQSLEVLITAGLLRRSPDSTHPARLYVLTPGSTLGGWLSSLLRFAATRDGRLAVLHALKQRHSSRPSAGAEDEPGQTLEHSHGG